MRADNEVFVVTPVVAMSFLVIVYNWTMFSNWRLKCISIFFFFFGPVRHLSSQAILTSYNNRVINTDSVRDFMEKSF